MAQSLNAISPYFTMFPLGFPLGILRRNRGRLRDEAVVLDPFCGRGTTNFAARLLAANTVGIDCNEVAVAATAAKLVSVDPKDIVEEAKRILSSADAGDVPTGEFWELAYDPEVLESLCRLRTALTHDCSSPVQIALRAIILGALHGPGRRNGSSYFSNQSPRTYAPKPHYAVRFWKERDLRPPTVNVIEIIRERAFRYYGTGHQDIDGAVARGDSRSAVDLTRALSGRRVSITVTSPPYFGLDTYLADQWIRSWFLGAKAKVDYSRQNQLRHGSREEFAEDLRAVWANVADHSEPGAKLVIRFGGINERKHTCPKEILRHSLRGGAWRILAVRPAGSATSGKQQARAFLKSKQKPMPEFDFHCVLG